MGFEQGALRSLNALQGAADGIGLAAEHLQLGTLTKIFAGFFGPAVAAEHETAVVKGSRIAAAAVDGCVERVECLGKVLREERVDSASVELIEKRVLTEGGCSAKTQYGGQGQTQFLRHENAPLSVPMPVSREPPNSHNKLAFIVVGGRRGCKQPRYGSRFTRMLR
jgi:hypothetical protein